MREYILSVIAVAALGSIAVGICPGGEGQGIKRTVSLIMSLLLILSVGKPLLGLTDAFDMEKFKEKFTYSGDSYEEAWHSTIVGVTEAGVRSAVSDALINGIGLGEDDFSVTCELSELGDVLELKSITVELFGGGLLKNPRSIEAELTDVFMCECTVK